MSIEAELDAALAAITAAVSELDARRQTVGMTTNEYRAELNAAEAIFARNLGEIFPTKVPLRIWRMAWNRGHSEGYWSAAQEYQEIAELVQVAQASATGQI